MKYRKWLLAMLLAGTASLQAQVAPLYTQDIGSPGQAGTATESAGVFTIEGGGADIWSSNDQFRFVYEELTGDGVITARVTGVENTNTYAKAGVMIRETLDANARNVMTAVHANASAQMQRRTTSNGSTTATAASGTGIPRWVRLARSTDLITSSVSSDGVSWTTIGTINLGSLASTVYVGLAVTSHNNSTLATATLDNVTLPSDVGPGAQFTAFERIEAENYTTQSGTGVYSGGTGQKVGSIENGTWIQFTGVDFEDGAVRFSASAASNSAGGTINLRLGSTSGPLIGSVAVPGTGGWNNFVPVQTTVSGATGVQDLFLVFTGGGGALLDVDYFQFEAPVSTLTSADVGYPATAGSAAEASGVYTIEAGGTDIGGASDQFHYVYQPMYGDGVMIARVASIEFTTQYAKGAIMLRHSLTGDSPHYSSVANAGGNIRFLRRLTTGGTTTASGTPWASPPRWLRITRVGNLITSHESSNGTSWTSLGSQTVSGLPDALYIGLAATSQKANEAATVVFDNVTWPTITDTDGDGMADAWETLYGLNPNSAADASLDPDNDGLSNLQEYWALSNPSTSGGPGGGTVTVSAITSSAYELEATPGLLRITRSGGTAAVNVNFTLSGTATSSDYVLKDSTGAVLQGGSVLLPSGANSLDITVLTAPDAYIEYPETLSFTVNTGSGYQVGGSSAATVNIYDATNTTANELLFVGYLTPETGSSASGLVQMYLNGQRNSARVSVTHSGITFQTNTYIRWGVPNGTGLELRPNLGTGNLSNIIWNIQPIPTVSGQDIIDGLFQIGGKYVFVNVGTQNYPGGEIAGTMVRRNGSINFTAPSAPPTIPNLTGDDLKRDVARFLIQATFGPTQADIDALANTITTTHGGNRIAGYTAWIDNQLSRDLTRHYDYMRAVELKALTPRMPLSPPVNPGDPVWPLPPEDPEDPPGPGVNAANYGRHAGAAWWVAAMYGHDQLKQRYSFALSEIFVIARNMQPLTILPAGPLRYYDMLGSHTTGNFRNLLEDVSKHPVMGEYLSHKQNAKATYDSQGNIKTSPDENYAREVMQLFSIGLVELHPDGTLKLDNTGALIPTYDNTDIAELAKVFTGWSYSKVMTSSDYFTPADNTNFYAGDGLGIENSWFPYGWMYPMKNFPSYHETGPKTFLGLTVPANQTGEEDLDDAMDHLYNHPNVGPFISRLLIQRFVTSNPSAGYIHRVASKFNNNGSGVRGDMAAVIKAILLDYEARSLTYVTNPTYGKQKEPILRYINMLKVLNGAHANTISDTYDHMPADQIDNYAAGATGMWFRGEDLIPELGQFPLSAPSVFNWFLPDYAPQGPISALGLVAPEMNITTESSTFRLINLFRQMIYSYGINNVELDHGPLAAEYDALKVGATHLQATEALFDRLDLRLCAGAYKVLYGNDTTPNPRTNIINTVAAMSGATTTNRVEDLTYLMTTSPVFVHQR